MNGMAHDPICDAINPDLIHDKMCHGCELVRRAREDEREALSSTPEYLLAYAAYAQGRIDAADAINSVILHELPVFDGDTPLSIAVRVRARCHAAATGERAPDEPPSALSIQTG